MKVLILSIPFVLLIAQAFYSCNCQLTPITLESISALSNSTLKILASGDNKNYKAISSTTNYLKSTKQSIGAILTGAGIETATIEIVKISTQSFQNRVINALNTIATTLTGCVPDISYPNNLNISTSCFESNCVSTSIQCQALYLQVVIDELIIALYTAAYNLNASSSVIVGSTWTTQSLTTISTQWSIVQASAAAYQNSNKLGSLINNVSSNFKNVLNAALTGTNLLLNKLTNGYRTLIITANNANQNQSLSLTDRENLILLSAAAPTLSLTSYSIIRGLNSYTTFNMPISTVGVSFSSMPRSTLSVINSYSNVGYVYASALKSFASDFETLMTNQQNNLTNLIVNTTQALTLASSALINQIVTDNITSCLNYSALAQNPFPNWLYQSDLRPIFQSALTNATNLASNYTNLMNSYANATLDCFKVGCAGNTIYPYSTWNVQCVNDFSFSDFCWSTGFPKILQRCPSAKAQALNACLDNITSIVNSLQPSNDLNLILNATFKMCNDFFSNNTELASIHLNSIKSGYEACAASSLPILGKSLIPKSNGTQSPFTKLF